MPNAVPKGHLSSLKQPNVRSKAPQVTKRVSHCKQRWDVPDRSTGRTKELKHVARIQCNNRTCSHTKNRSESGRPCMPPYTDSD